MLLYCNLLQHFKLPPHLAPEGLFTTVVSSDVVQLLAIKHQSLFEICKSQYCLAWDKYLDLFCC